VLKELKMSTEGLRSKSWDEFTGADAPHLDFVFTVCDNAAGEVCPFWPGQPMTAHWGVEDPAAVEGSNEHKLAAFKRIANQLNNRIKMFTSIPLASLDNIKIKKEIDAIGKTVD
jgi:arsenate reductase